MYKERENFREFTDSLVQQLDEALGAGSE
jgi:hypothetical protein